MRRLVVSFNLCALALVALAQNPFNIVKPIDGSKVREVVKFQIPKNSIPPNSYVGIFVNDKFLEATVLSTNGKFYEYSLDTKAKKIIDGKTKFEFVLYTEFNDTSRVVDRSSVVLNVANTQNISIPSDGLKMRYRFNAGSEWIFKLTQLSKVESLTGGRGTLLGTSVESFRMLYAVDDAYGNGDGLVRITALPDKDKSYLTVALDNDPVAKRYDQISLAPVFMRLTSTGSQAFGAVPLAIPLSGSAGGYNRLDLYAALPLPTLPARSVKPGDAWQTRFQFGSINFDNLANTSSVITPVPARGEFLGVEWQDGRPCAKIRQSLSEKRDVSGRKQAVEQVIWFALDRRQIIRMEQKMTFEANTGAVAAPGQGGGGRAGGGGGAGGRAGGRGGGGGGRGGDGEESMAPPLPAFFQDPRGGGGRPGVPGGGNPGAGQGGPTPAPRTNSPAIPTGLRTTVYTVWKLEG